MIQNEILPGCAVLYDDEVMIQGEFWTITSNKSGRIKPIPLTAESVPNVKGCTLFKAQNGKWLYFYFNTPVGKVFIHIGKYHVTLTRRGSKLPHITSIHQLQVLIYSLTGTMPKYDIG